MFQRWGDYQEQQSQSLSLKVRECKGKMRENDAGSRWLSEGSLSRGMETGKFVVSVAQMCSTELVTPGFPVLCPHHLPLS